MKKRQHIPEIKLNLEERNRDTWRYYVRFRGNEMEDIYIYSFYVIICYIQILNLNLAEIYRHIRERTKKRENVKETKRKVIGKDRLSCKDSHIETKKQINMQRKRE